MNELDTIKAKYKAAWGDFELLMDSLNSGMDQDVINSCINKVLSSAEVAFLSSKNLIKYYSSEKKLAAFCKEGPWVCEKTNDGIHFVLPAMVSKHNKNKAASDGKAIRNLAMKLLAGYSDSGMPFSHFEITFIFHVGRIGVSDAIPDFDNLDIKAFIDALQGIVLRNDTVLDYDLHAYGVEDTKSFTEIWIMKAEKGVEKHF